MVDFTIPDLTAIGGALADNTLFEVHRSGQAASEKAAGSDLKTYLGHRLNNFTATANPGVGDDANAGYGVGSYWLNAASGVLFVCRSATAGAAVWNAVDDDAGAGYTAGNWYRTETFSELGTNAGQSEAVALVPFHVRQRVTITDMGCFVGQADAAGNAQLGLYASNPANGKPTGNALSNTNNISMAAVAVASGALLASVTLEPGRIYYKAANYTGFGRLTHAASIPSGAQYIGSSTLAGQMFNSTVATSGYVVIQTFGTWPDLTAATPLPGPIHAPVIFLKAG